jgi:hypothetical protein
MVRSANMPGYAVAGSMLLLIMTLPVTSCKEEFPPYTEPENVLQGEMQIDIPDTVNVYFDGANYYFNGAFVIGIVVTNVFDDLLQGKALINGRVFLQSFSQVPRAFVVPLSVGDLRSPPVVGGNIAIGPGRQAEFSVLWVPISTDEEVVFAGLPYTEVGSDRLYGPIDFIAYADIQLFERVQPIRLPSLQFSLVFKVSN